MTTWAAIQTKGGINVVLKGENAVDMAEQFIRDQFHDTETGRNRGFVGCVYGHLLRLFIKRGRSARLSPVARRRARWFTSCRRRRKEVITSWLPPSL
jgi:hypothetical protein